MIVEEGRGPLQRTFKRRCLSKPKGVKEPVMRNTRGRSFQTEGRAGQKPEGKKLGAFQK